jgi:hypothetical protein
MKISVKQLRKVIKEVLNEMPYMRPHHMRGIGPDVDPTPKQGKYTPEQVMKLFPKAARAFVQKLRSEDPEVFGNWYPRDIIDQIESWRTIDGNLMAEPDEGRPEFSGPMVFIDSLDEWVPLDDYQLFKQDNKV